MKWFGCKIAVFKDDEILYCYQHEGDKREIINFLNKKTNELIVKNYFFPERKIMYKIYTSQIPEKWSTIEELVEGGKVKLAKD